MTSGGMELRVLGGLSAHYARPIVVPRHDLGLLGHLNLLECSRESARWAVGGEIAERDGVLLCSGGTWIPVNFNNAWRTIDTVQARTCLDLADEFFSRLGCGYSVKVRKGVEADNDLEEACRERGLAIFDEPAPQMACGRRLEAILPEDCRIEVVETEADVADLATVTGAAYGTYGLPEGEAQIAFGNAAALLAAPHVFSVVVRRRRQAVAAAMGLASHGIAGLYWVGTMPAARGQGLGAAVTAAITNEALERGADAVTLQASVMGRPIYERLGYETLYHYANYVCWSPPGR